MVNGEDKPLQGSGDRSPPWSLNHACTGLDPLHRRPEPAEGQTAGTAEQMPLRASACPRAHLRMSEHKMSSPPASSDTPAPAFTSQVKNSQLREGKVPQQVSNRVKTRIKCSVASPGLPPPILLPRT